MRLPNFTAELALNRSTGFFRAAGAAGVGGGGAVSPQLRIGGDPVGSCYSWCFLNGGNPLQCFFACGPGQLGGGVFNAGTLA